MHKASVIGAQLILHYDFIIRAERQSGGHYCYLQMLVNPGTEFTVMEKKDNGFNLKVKVKLLSHARLFVTPWTVAYQASRSMGFSKQEY